MTGSSSGSLRSAPTSSRGEGALDRAEDPGEPRGRGREGRAVAPELASDVADDHGLQLAEVAADPDRRPGPRAQAAETDAAGPIGGGEIELGVGVAGLRGPRRSPRSAPGVSVASRRSGRSASSGSGVRSTRLSSQSLASRSRSAFARDDPDCVRTLHQGRKLDIVPVANPSFTLGVDLTSDERATGEGESTVDEAPGGDAIIGATLEGLRRAAEEVEHVAEVAETLQRSLLPERLPELPGLEVSARYVAGSAPTLRWAATGTT